MRRRDGSITCTSSRILVLILGCFYDLGSVSSSRGNFNKGVRLVLDGLGLGDDAAQRVAGSVVDRVQDGAPELHRVALLLAVGAVGPRLGGPSQGSKR